MKNHIDTPERPGAFGPNNGRTLDKDQINTLHAASLEIMERTGMRFFDPEALDLFRSAGCRISDGNIVHLSLIHISEPTRLRRKSRMPSSA